MTIHVALQEKALWRDFDAQQNEMIITKIGRNLFPILEFMFKGLTEHTTYRIGITMEAINYHKLKFTAGRWEALDVMEELIPSNEVFVVKSGRDLLQRGLKLEKLKLTNSKEALEKSDQMIRVQSMRQYVPILNIYEILVSGAVVQVGKYQFPETKFIAVTAYQSEKVKHLKVQKNKFAQGFREGVKSTSSAPKRPTSTTSSNSTSPDSTLSTSPILLGPDAKKGRAQQLQYPKENIPPTSSYYPFPMQQFQNFQPNFQQNYHGSFDPTSYWNPQNPQVQYDFSTVGHSNPYGYQYN